MIVLDELRLSFTSIFLLVAFLTILISTFGSRLKISPAGEFHSLLLFATSGMMLMASAGDLVIVFLDSKYFRLRLMCWRDFVAPICARMNRL
jgi:NADH-quinone oxidoreductase subunit N